MAIDTIKATAILDGSVDTADLADNAVTTAKIGDGEVTSAKLDTNIDIAGTLDVTGVTTLDDGLVVDNDGATVATFDRATSDGTIVDFQKDGSSVGEIRSLTGDLIIGTGTAALAFSDYYPAITPYNITGSTYQNNAMDLGNSGSVFRHVYVGGSIYLGGTTAANALDDYEEGTWTPILIGSSGDPTSTTYGNQTGRYTKVGNTVFAAFQIALNSGYGNGSGQIRVSALPFVSNLETMSGNVAMETFSSKVDKHVTPMVSASSAQVKFINLNLSGGWTYIEWGNNTSGTIYIYGSITYYTDS